MIDPNFDPYHELMLCQHNTHELARAMNQQSALLKDLSEQHRELIALMRQYQKRIEQLESEVFILKNP